MKDAAKVDLKAVTEKDKAAEERQRLAILLLRKQKEMTEEFGVLTRHTGGYLSKSMCVAYEKGISDVIKLILKEKTNEESVQSKEEPSTSSSTAPTT